ncbi:UDP-glucuronic acid decarboxylase 1 isoform X1 [Sagmatias obliquidens]|uniref:UDP-glucuronic acid decarboxylase 1 n=2 Tax=Tursiops truncatus TaxID=9739 RepID=A0A6J3PXG7_TURTR|nr:UDP-glucuronic acid decarboxylase 1 isoform X1 [Lagenorhynchus obliquidens]XP_030700934.1 UDP-glucuronic acid decarboxylase 1 isoform X1 [Globicephala melas]XP_033694759.1 UDP-glucuronic acid decarboxylase 1 isoform X1 [Tursiops truncatus]
MLSQALLRLASAVSRRRMKLLLGIALLAYVASIWGNLVNMSFLLNRSIQENGELKIESRIEEIVEPLREKIRDLEKSFTQKYPPVKFLSEKDRKRILVTGGAGFVGSHLTDKLMMDGHEVTVVDNFFTGRKRNVEHWIGHENFELINHDVVEPLYIEVDQIYHLASPASPPSYMYNPIKTLKTNTIGTLNMLGLAKRVGARLLLASTSEVYGDPEVHPQTEDYWGHVNPIGPRACYDEGKRVAETMCYAYMKQPPDLITENRASHQDGKAPVSGRKSRGTCGAPGSPSSVLQEGVEVRVARIFNTFGPRMHMNDGRVVSNFILQALQGEPLTVYGSGSQTRAFQYVSDLVNGLVALMNSNVSSPVNLGNPEEHTILEFAELIKNLVGSGSEIQFLSEAQDDPQKRKPDIKKAKLMLGWEPVVPLEEGLNKAIHYFRKELEYQANNQYIPKPKPARIKKGRTRHT